MKIAGERGYRKKKKKEAPGAFRSRERRARHASSRQAAAAARANVANVGAPAGSWGGTWEGGRDEGAPVCFSTPSGSLNRALVCCNELQRAATYRSTVAHRARTRGVRTSCGTVRPVNR